MKKTAIVIVILLLTILKLNDYEGILTKEINIYSVSKIVGGNLYEDTIGVSATNIAVIDYEVVNEALYIKPTKSTIILPLDGIIIEVGSNYLVLETDYGEYNISNIDNREYNLYQFYFKNTILGYSNQYKVEGEDYQPIVSNLIINYEAI